MALKKGNINIDIPDPEAVEIFETLAANKQFKVERIVSRGHCTPEGEWLDQAHDEWVLVIRGQGRLAFKGNTPAMTLKPGDYVFIPAHTLHRVEWTSPRTKTVWLAVHAR